MLAGQTMMSVETLVMSSRSTVILILSLTKRERLSSDSILGAALMI